MDEWKKVRLGNIVETNQNTYSIKENWEFVNYLDTGNLTTNQIETIQYIDLSKEKLPSRAKRKVKYNSIIYSTVRPNQLHYGIVKEQPENFLVSTGFVVVDVDCSVANPDYIYYILTQQEITEHLQAIGEQSVSAYPSIKPSDIEDLEIELPPIAEQNKIVSILSAIDKKTKSNNLINKNLFEQAKAFFNNTLQQSESISYVGLGSLANVKGGKRLPKGTNLITIPNSHPYIRVRDLNNAIFVSLSSDYEYVDEETQKSIARYITSTGDVLVSIVGTIGLTAIVDETLNNANLTENCVKLTNLRGITPEYLLLFLRSNAGIEAINKGTVGAVQLKLPIKNIQSISVPLISPTEMQALDDILSVIFNQISANVIETKRLSELRDTLLPKLMSGELDVSNIDL